jgi:hypothetical protein
LFGCLVLCFGLLPLAILVGWLTANHPKSDRVYDIGPEVNGIPMTWL